MIAAIESQDLALIFGAAFVFWAPVVGGLVANNRQTKQINAAVNNRPKDQPTLLQRVEKLEVSVAEAAETAKSVKADLQSQASLDTYRHNENKTALSDTNATLVTLAKQLKTLGAAVKRLEAGPAATTKRST